MQYTNLIDAKKHLNIESEYIDDDNYITQLLNVSELAVSNYCNDTFSGYTITNIPSTIVQAIYILMSNFYVNRQPVSFAQGYAIPYTFDFLLYPYMNFTIV